MYRVKFENKENLELEIKNHEKNFETNNLLLSDSSKKYVCELEDLRDKYDGEIEYCLCFIYLDGKLIEKDTDKAIEYLKQSHDKKFYDATVALAIMYYYGYIVDKNLDLTNEYITNLVDNSLDDDDLNQFYFKESYDLYELIKKASGLNDFDATKLIVDFYIKSAEDSNDVPEYWKHRMDDYYYLCAVDWLEDLSYLGDKTAMWCIYEIFTDNFPYADKETVYYYLKNAALYDEYPPAVEEYDNLKESGDLDDLIESENIFLDED